MANREKFLSSFSTKFKRQNKLRDEVGNGGHKKRRPNWDKQRRMKESQWEDKEDEQ